MTTIGSINSATDLAITNSVLPAGVMMAYGGSVAPSGWLLCDGTAVSRSTYASLFTAISTTYGTGDGSTTFNTPDLRGRVPVGVDGAAGRLDASDALGNTGGEQKHTLTVGELAAHDHGGGAHTHPSTGFDYLSGDAGDSGYANVGSGVGVVYRKSTIETSGAIVTSQGSGTAHNNMQPYQVVNWIIKI